MPEGGGGGGGGGARVASPSQPSTLPVTQLDKSLTVSVTPCMAHSSVNEHSTSLDSIAPASPHLTTCLTTHVFHASHVILTFDTSRVTTHSSYLRFTPPVLLTPHASRPTYASQSTYTSLLPFYLRLTSPVLLTPHAFRPTYTSRLTIYLNLTPYCHHTRSPSTEFSITTHFPMDSVGVQKKTTATIGGGFNMLRRSPVTDGNEFCTESVNVKIFLRNENIRLASSAEPRKTCLLLVGPPGHPKDKLMKPMEASLRFIQILSLSSLACGAGRVPVFHLASVGDVTLTRTRGDTCQTRRPPPVPPP
ncbi:hypothetical protein Pmani_037840 [Petrolisthes manimaculis]|uniref:Uncharacterized protein n=1 Tax=Petrolisthes manimaculis TaxID=1843537 RepID=A0AAE1NFN0_9EUCA|nr:hypothetical protein Pmani_037840 [Petrolisthes manimaculis]